MNSLNKKAAPAMLVLVGLVLVLVGTTAWATPGQVISVLDLHNEAGLDEAEVSYLTDLARDALARNLPLDRYFIMTRESILELLPEGTRLSDCLDASCEVEIGRTLGADYVVSGEVLEFGGELRLILKAHHCSSAAFIGSESSGGVGLKELEIEVAQSSSLLAQRISNHSGTMGQGVAKPPTSEPIVSLDQWWIKAEAPGVSGQEMILVEPGHFLMGSPRYEENRELDEERHQVTLTRPYLLAATEVTQAQWREIMNSSPSKFQGDDLPVENVTYAQCVEYCNQLSKREGLTPAYGHRGDEIYWNREADGYRLPTEAEWEFACRAGSQKRFANGDRETQLNEVGWFRRNSSGGTHEVGTRGANSWGFYDMHGNVWEWCWNWSAPYPERFAKDPEGPSRGTSRVIRGGSWDTPAAACRSANHNGAKPSFHGAVLGFRVCRTVQP